MEEDRKNHAKYLIFRYAEELFTCVSDLLHPELEELMNLPSHGLSKDELIDVLFDLFSNHELVAARENRGLFTPTLEEIVKALDEPNDIKAKLSNTYYGITSAAIEPLKMFEQKYGN